MKKLICLLLDLLYPRHCTTCGKELKTEEQFLCQDCWEDLPLTYYWSWRENPAERILWGRTYLIWVCSLFFYHHESSYSRILKKIKYEGGEELAFHMGGILGQKMKESGILDGISYLVPVPLHPKKKRLRGYNQSERIAEGISSVSGIPISTGILIRTRFTRTQTKINVGNKWENVEKAFSLAGESQYEGQHILLVDDVLTTGATAESCFSALKEIRDIRVSLATLAFVRSD